jgi:ribonuclease G
MEKMEHRESVFNALIEALKKDRAKTNVLPISGLGLVEMTRKRTRDTLTRVMCEPCPYCEGTGRVKSDTSVCYEILRELYKVVKKTQSSKISVFAHPEVSAQLSTDLGIIETIEEQFDKEVVIRADNNYHIEQYEIYPG